MFTVVRKNLMFLQKNPSDMFLALNLQIRVNIGFFFNGFICIKKKIKQ